LYLADRNQKGKTCDFTDQLRFQRRKEGIQLIKKKRGESGYYWGRERDNSATTLDGVISGFGLDQATERLLDVVAATMGLILFAPIRLIVSIAAGSQGPIFVSEMKYGYDDQAINVVRFRVVSNPRATQIGQILNQTGMRRAHSLSEVLPDISFMPADVIDDGLDDVGLHAVEHLRNARLPSAAGFPGQCQVLNYSTPRGRLGNSGTPRVSFHRRDRYCGDRQ
jgi:hypothetical protein